jgi:DNA-binding beta-propeller fold protein YncE
MHSLHSRFLWSAVVAICCGIGLPVMMPGQLTGQGGYDVYTYVTEYSQHSVVVFKNLQKLDTIVTSGKSTNSIAITPDNTRLYVSNDHGNSVSALAVDPASQAYGKEIGVIPTNARPVDVKVHPDGSKVYVAAGRAVSVIDSDPDSPTYNTVVNVINMPGRASDLDLAPGGDQLFVVHYLEGRPGNLSVIDTLEDSLVDTDSNPANGITPMKVGQHADRRMDWYRSLRIGPFGYGYILNTETAGRASGRGNTISVFDTASMLPYDVDGDPTTTTPGEEQGITAIEIPGFLPVALHFDPDGTRLYVTQRDTIEDANSIKGKILMIDTDPASPRFNQIVKVQETGIRPEGVGVWPDGRYVWVSCRMSRFISVFDSNLRPVTTLPMRDSGAMVSVKRPKSIRAVNKPIR